MSPFAVEYWLGRCEGFRVDVPGGHVGFVDAVLASPETGAPVTLLVRVPGPDGPIVAVPVEEIEEIALEGERIVLRRTELTWEEEP
jgi:hypothetical protein